MEHLPVEILSQVFKNLSKKDLASLSRSCVAFGTVAQSILFGEVFLSLAGSIWDEDEYYRSDSANARTLERFFRSIVENAALAGLVRHLTLSISTYGATTHTIPPQLFYFVNLHTLTLVSFQIDIDFIDSLPLFVNLRLVHLRDCRLQSSGPQGHSKEFPACSSLEIVISHPTLGHGWQFLIPQGLRSLALEMVQYMDGVDAGLSDLSQCHRHSLTRLHFYNVSADIIPFLSSCPQLRCIAFPCHDPLDFDIISSLKSLPSHAIPLLEDFSGHAEYAEAFIRDRPVHTASIYFCEETSVDALRALELSTVSVTKLEVGNLDADDNGDPIPIDIPQYLPTTLKYFSFGMQFSRWVVSCLPILSKLPHLRVIRGTCLDGDEELREELVHAASKACSSLEEVVFDIDPESSAWHEIEMWLRSADGVWTYSSSW